MTDSPLGLKARFLNFLVDLTIWQKMITAGIIWAVLTVLTWIFLAVFAIWSPPVVDNVLQKLAETAFMVGALPAAILIVVGLIVHVNVRPSRSVGRRTYY